MGNERPLKIKGTLAEVLRVAVKDADRKAAKQRTKSKSRTKRKAKKR